jgi:hypothetical protein
VQASRWSHLANGEGFIYSFNGPHSLFADTMRSLRSLAMAYQLGHVLMGERDEQISLLKRLVDHVRTDGPVECVLRQWTRQLRRPLVGWRTKASSM